jgi:hypothetical protein
MMGPMSTYFLVTTVDADDPNDAIAIARSMDEPTEVPTIDELRTLFSIVLDSYNRDREWAAKDGKRTEAAKYAAVARLIQIATLGNVTA